jgi:tRNA(Ile)-lysidine synthase
VTSFLNETLLSLGDRLLVALSGGPDSLSLLHALVGHPELEVGAIHVHHGMRGAEADSDVEYLKSLCEGWGVPLAVEYADVPALAAERRMSAEEAGRDARYAAFAKVATEQGWGKVATAHNADDQAETVLMRLLRGTGTDGLAGIPERRSLARGVEVVRPLLRTPRSAIEAYCREHGLKPLQDATNLDVRYRRSQVRYQVLPLLEEYSPSVRDHLRRLAAQAREERDLMDGLAERVLVQAARVEQDDAWPWLPAGERVVIRVSRLLEAGDVLARRALRMALRGASPGVEVDAELLARLLRLMRAISGAIELPGCSYRAVRLGGDLVILRAAPDPLEGEVVPLALRGSTVLPGWGAVIEAASVGRPQDLRVPAEQALLDRGALHPPLRVRSPRRGDRFHPLNAPGTKLLSDLFVDRKIARDARASWPVVEDEDGIVWVPGLMIAHRARVSEGTRECLHLRIGSAPDGSGSVV